MESEWRWRLASKALWVILVLAALTVTVMVLHPWVHPWTGLPKGAKGS